MLIFFLSDRRQGTTNAAAKDLCFQTARHLSKTKTIYIQVNTIDLFLQKHT